MLVHVVGQHPDMRMLHQHVGQRLELGARIGRAGGVRRRVEHHPLGPRRDRALQGFRLQLVAVLHAGRHDDRLAPVDRHHLRVADPERRGDDDLVAGVHRHQEGVVEDLLAAGGDDGVGGLVVEPVLPLELGGDRLAQRGNAEHRRILGLAAPDGVDGRVLDVVGRVEVGLADRQRDDVPAFGFQIARLLRDDHGRGRLYAIEHVGEEGHRSVPN